MNFRKYTPFSALFILCSVSGCGTMVPQIQEIWDSKSAEDQAEISAGGALELHIKAKVYCDVRRAVIAAWAKKAHRKGHDERLLPENWGVQTTLDLQVDETGALNPGVSFITPTHAGITNFKGEFLTTSTTAGLGTATFPFLSSPQSYNLGIGGTLSSQATREDKFEYYWNVDKLKLPLKGDSCADPNESPLLKPRHGSSFLREGDLGIEQWLLVDRL